MVHDLSVHSLARVLSHSSVDQYTTRVLQTDRSVEIGEYFYARHGKKES